MKLAQTLQKKRSSQKGFTLMEMLIVVAIIAILVAIAIPVFSAQLDNARAQVDAANLRSATSMAVTNALSTSITSETTYYGIAGKENTLTVNTDKSASGGFYAPQSSANAGCHIEVVVEAGGNVKDAKWIK